MIDKEQKDKEKSIVTGLLAHVDAGKTTLSEAMLYLSGSIRNLGRVDKGDAFLDSYALEKERGITIFSKQAQILLPNSKVTLLDTPGHVDFATEMERTLQVLDYAILIISAADGLQGHTRTLWYLLKQYHIPTFIFINKMDQPDTSKTKIIRELKQELGDGCLDFSDTKANDFFEEIAMSDEQLLEAFLENQAIDDAIIGELIAQRKIFPCYFGAALPLEGIEEFMRGFDKYTLEKSYPVDFGAKVYKISRDDKGNRLTHLKVTGGQLKVRSVLSKGGEKVTNIRLYSGDKYETTEIMAAGNICAITGLSETYPGEGLGIEADSNNPLLEPVMSYRLILPADCEVVSFFPKIKQLEEEEPALLVKWNKQLNEIQVQVMGEIQLDILKRLIRERFDILVEFDAGTILYKETISNTVEGVGHFEPLKHYAEVHLMLEPGTRGSGLSVSSACSEDMLERNWQMQILSYLTTRKYKGVLTGSEITDLKITLVAGRAHNKHTTGGDFSEATIRALRQGLMEAESILLEPYYTFKLEIPKVNIGRAISDIEMMGGSFVMPSVDSEMVVLTGEAPVTKMQNYHLEVSAYSKGNGRLFCTVKGYAPCKDAPRIIADLGYNPEADIEEPCGSMFCSHGAGFYVPWNQVKEHMHIESQLREKVIEKDQVVTRSTGDSKEMNITNDEIEEIFAKTFRTNIRSEFIAHKGINKGNREKKVAEVPLSHRIPKKRIAKDSYLLVDGYNIIHAWAELAELAKVDIMAARDRLQDILCNYQGIKQMKLIVVFDAYKVKCNEARAFAYHNINVVYTKEAETADEYIEKFAYENSKKYDVMVATSDGLEQIIIRGAGSTVISARELEQEVEAANRNLQEEYAKVQPSPKESLNDILEDIEFE